MKKSKRDFLIFLFTAAFFALTLIFTPQSQDVSDQRRLLVPPPENIEQMQFGFKESMADSFWLRWVQDTDTCYVAGKEIERKSVESSEEEAAKIKADRLYNPRYKECDNSWAFKMLEAVTKLDPRFKMPYMLGAGALAVMVEDYKGASVIFDRGLNVYPKDWEINFRAAYHFMYDTQDLPKAARLLNTAAENGGPNWLPALAARLYTRSGQLELAIASLLNFRKAYTDKNQIADLDKRIAGLQAQLDNERRK